MFYRTYFQDILQNISSVENETVRIVYNDTVSHIMTIMELLADLNSTMGSNFLFEFIDGFKENYVEDFSSQLVYDLLRNLGNSER